MKNRNLRKAISGFVAVLLSVSLVDSSFATGIVGYSDRDSNSIYSPIAGGFSANYTTDAGQNGNVFITAAYDKLSDTDELISVQSGTISGGSATTGRIELDTIDGYVFKNFVWDSMITANSLEAVQTSVVKLTATPKEGYLLLNWDATNNTSDCTYTILRNGSVLASGLSASQAAYIDATDDTTQRSYQVKVMKGSKAVGMSNIVNAAASARTAPTPPVKGYSDGAGSTLWKYDLSKTPTTSGGFTYTDPQLKLNYNTDIWTVTTSSLWDSNGSKNWVTKDFSENIIKVTRASGTNLSHSLVLIFGDEIRAYDTVNVSFDHWGSKRWQNPKFYYRTGGNNTNVAIQINDNDWRSKNYNTSTDMELSSYGYPGKYGVVFTYQDGPDENYYLWIKNIKVTPVKSDTYCSTITADSSEASYIDMMPSGYEMPSMHGNLISGGTVIRGSTSAWANYMVYAYRNVSGTDAFYFTQTYDESVSADMYGDKGFLAFDIDDDIGVYGVGSWVRIEYFDGTSGDITTKNFNVHVVQNRYNDMVSLGTVTMTGDNTWKTAEFQITDGNYTYFNKNSNKDDLDSMDIVLSLTSANDSYNQNGILVKSVSIMDDAYYDDVLPLVEAYETALEAYNAELAVYNAGVSIPYPGGVSIDFNKAGATATPEIEDWQDETITGLAYLADACNNPSDYSDRTNSYGLHGPAGDQRYSVSTESFTNVRAIGGAAGGTYGKQTFIYGKVDSAYMDSSSQYAEVEITYYDYSDYNMVIKFKRAIESGHHTQYIAQTGTNTWKTATFRLTDAMFNKSDNGGYDFRLSLESNANDASIKQLIVSKIVVRSAADMTQDIASPSAVPNVYIMGDSIAAKYIYNTHQGEGRYGWGEKLDLGTVNVFDYAVAGTSTVTYCKNGAIDAAKENDYVLISFGHNDSTTGQARSATVSEYKANLTNIVLSVMEKGAVPVIITSIPSFNGSNINATTDSVAPYRSAALEIAEKYSLPSIDLGAALAADPQCTAYFVSDNLHLNETGAQAAANIVRNGLLTNARIRTLKKFVD